VHRAARETAARQGIVDRRDAERQDAVAQRLLDLPDAITQRGEAGRSRPLRNARPHHMRKTHLLTCFYR
jgi:hypothetical protein